MRLIIDIFLRFSGASEENGVALPVKSQSPEAPYQMQIGCLLILQQLAAAARVSACLGSWGLF